MHRNLPRGLLLIDDATAHGGLVSAFATRAGWKVLRAADVINAIAVIEQRSDRIDAVLLCCETGTADIGEALAQLRRRLPHLPIIVSIAAEATDRIAPALRAGASDFVTTPIAYDRLIAALGHATTSEAEGELRPLAEKPLAAIGFDRLVGAAPGFRAAIEQAQLAAETTAPLMIEGEPGVGKEAVARAVHLAGERGDRPFVAVDCGAIPANLAESELFGHERGAFPGAFDRRAGHLAAADGGTIFLDRIDRLPADLQARLAWTLQSGEILPLGARVPRTISVRLIAAIDHEPADGSGEVRLHPDLAARLAPRAITVPALRDRIDDLAELSRSILARIATDLAVAAPTIDPAAIRLLARYPWPGNVRQLHDVLLRAAIGCSDEFLTPAQFRQLAAAVASGRPANMVPDATEAGFEVFQPDGHVRSLEAIEADMIRLAIRRYGGRMTEVARRLGIGRSTLYRKLAELGLEDA
jgi:DNA-binding NtrC family response regulator